MYTVHVQWNIVKSKTLSKCSFPQNCFQVTRIINRVIMKRTKLLAHSPTSFSNYLFCQSIFNGHIDSRNGNYERIYKLDLRHWLKYLKCERILVLEELVQNVFEFHVIRISLMKYKNNKWWTQIARTKFWRKKI